MPLIKTIRPHYHPFPFLLYGEWILVGIALISEFSPSVIPKNNGVSSVVLFTILGFGFLGLWLPRKPQGLKIAHIILQFSLLVLAAELSTVGLRLFPLLQIVLVMRSCLIFRLPGRLLVTGATFCFFLGVVQKQLQTLNRLQLPELGEPLISQLISVRINLMVMFAVLLAFLLLFMNALLSERERREELRQANLKLKASASQIERLAMTQERARIAREIHDALGHALTGLNIQLEGALKLWDINPEQARTFVNQAKQMGSIALDETRHAVAALRQLPSTDLDIASIIAPLTQQLHQAIGIMPNVEIDSPPLPESIRLTVYRMVQEALTNICKYSQATEVNIIIQSSSDASLLNITIQDNGVGFYPKENTTGFGLRGIQERAQSEGGQVDFITAPGQGCTIKI